MLKRITIRGSIVGTRKDLDEALAFAAEGKVKSTIERGSLASVEQDAARMKEGRIQGRVVLALDEA